MGELEIKWAEAEERLKSLKCVGCGYCCLKVVCVYGQMEYGVDPAEKCPGLYWNGSMYRCRLIEKDSIVAEALGANTACCSALTGWRKHVKERRHRHEDQR